MKSLRSNPFRPSDHTAATYMREMNMLATTIAARRGASGMTEAKIVAKIKIRIVAAIPGSIDRVKV